MVVQFLGCFQCFVLFFLFVGVAVVQVVDVAHIPHCCELWCSLQTRLGSRIAVAVVQASSYSSNLTLNTGTAICCWCSPKKQKIRERKKKKKKSLSHNSDNTGSLTCCATRKLHLFFYSSQFQSPCSSLLNAFTFPHLIGLNFSDLIFSFSFFRIVKSNV